ncbi:MAG: homoserine kinase [Lysobacteraceae bacterium]
MTGMSRNAGWSRAFAPASVGNIGVGFDLLGHSIDGPRDEVSARRIDEPAVRILRIDGNVPGIEQLPLDAEANTAGRALISLRGSLGLAHGFELTIHKGIALGSGLGGSAASCVAALVAANALLDQPLPREALYPFALDGESASSGSRHGDNVAPMLLGGVVMALENRMIRLPTPDWLWCTVVHPDQVLHTRRAREVLQAPYALHEAVMQSQHLVQFLTGLQTNDRELIGNGLHDVLVEPRRASLIPGFAAVKTAALDSGALGASISGAGPSVFAWCDSRDGAERAGDAMKQAFAEAGFQARRYVSPVAGPRAECIPEHTAEEAE